MIAEFAVVYLARWAAAKAGRAAHRLDETVDEAVDAGVDRLHDLVAARLGAGSALSRLEQDARMGMDDAQSRAQLTAAVQAAARADAAWAQQLETLVRAVEASTHEQSVRTVSVDARAYDHAQQAVQGSGTTTNHFGRG